MTIVDFLSLILGLATILSQIFILVSVIYLVFFSKKYPNIIKYFTDRALLFSFIISLVATLGSLFYSTIAGFVPCELCWFQRIFMYPLAIISGLALIKKNQHVIIDYILTLSSIGFLISLYHNYIYSIPQTANFCSINSGVSCATPYITEFGYVTIPVMALTAFCLMIILLISKKVV